MRFSYHFYCFIKSFAKVQFHRERVNYFISKPSGCQELLSTIKCPHKQLHRPSPGPVTAQLQGDNSLHLARFFLLQGVKKPDKLNSRLLRALEDHIFPLPSPVTRADYGFEIGFL